MPYVTWEDGAYCKFSDVEEYIEKNNKTDNYEIVYFDSEEELLDNYIEEEK